MNGVDRRQEFRKTALERTRLREQAAVCSFVTGLAVDEYFTRSDSLGAHVLLSDPLGSTLAPTNSAGTIPSMSRH